MSIFDVERDAVPVGLLGNQSTTLMVVAGDTLYYADNSQVSSTNNQGSLTAGNSATFTENVWVVSASRSSVSQSFTGGSSGGGGATITSPDGSVVVGGTPTAPTLKTQSTPGVIYYEAFALANGYPAGTSFSNPGSRNHAAGINAALNAARAITTLGNGVGVVELDAACYFISGALNCYNATLRGQGSGTTRIVPTSDFAAGLPVNSRFAIDAQGSNPLGAPTQNAPSQAAGTSAYTLNQVVSIWVTAANARNGGETLVSAMQQITVAVAGNSITVNWAAITGADPTTTYSIYMDRAGGTVAANAVRVAAGQTGTSYTDTTGTGGTVHPPTSDTTGGVGIIAPDYSRIFGGPNFCTKLEGFYLNNGVATTVGAVPWHMSGIRQAQGSVIRDVVTNPGFFAGIYQNLDHEKIYNSRPHGYYGLYRGGPHGTDGDQVIADCEFDGCLWAAIGIGASAALIGASIRRNHFGNPFGIYKEQNDPQSVTPTVLDRCDLHDNAFESCGNGNIFSAGTMQGSVSGTVFDSHTDNCLDPGIGLPTTTTDQQGIAIGRKNCAVDLNGGPWNGNYVFQDILSLHPSATYSCAINAVVGQGGQLNATTILQRMQADGGKNWQQAGAYPAADVSVSFYNQVSLKDCRIMKAVSAINQWDLAVAGTGVTVPAAAEAATGRPIGVVQISAANNGYAVIAVAGIAHVHTGANVVAAGDVLIIDGVTAGQAKSNGTTPVAGMIGYAISANGADFANYTKVKLQGLN